MSIQQTQRTVANNAEDKTQLGSMEAISVTAHDDIVVQRRDSNNIREIPNQDVFDKVYGYRRVNVSLGRKAYYHFTKVRGWKKAQWMEFVKDRIPILRWMKDYRREWLVTDILAGFFVSIMSVPQGLAYGYLAKVPPQHGLYTTIFLSIVYFVLGSSKHNSPGAFAIISMMVGVSVERVFEATNNIVLSSSTDSENVCCKEVNNLVMPDNAAIEVVVSITFLVGIWQLIFGLLNAGLLAVWLGEYVVKGFMSGAAIHVVASQVKTMTGLKNLPPTSSLFGLPKFLLCLFMQIKYVNGPSFGLSIVSMTLLLLSSYVIDPLVKRCTKNICDCKIKFPMELVLVVVSTLSVFLLKDSSYRFLVDKFERVGKVSGEMYKPAVPRFDYPMEVLLSSSASIAVLSFAIHIALAKLVAKMQNYKVNSNQEWFALGAMHTIASFFGCFAGGSSLGRTMLQEKMGVKSQISSLTCALVILVGVVSGGTVLIHDLPKPVLAAIIVIALKDLLIEMFTCGKLYKVSNLDCIMFYQTLVAVVVLGVNTGILVGIVFALLTIVFRSQWPESCCVGRIPGTADYKGLGQYRVVETIAGMRLYRFDAPIYFANAELFLDRAYSAVGADPVEIKGYQEKVRLQEKAREKKGKVDRAINNEEKLLPDEFTQLTHVIVDCSAVPYIDLMGKDAMIQLFEGYVEIGIKVYFAHCKVQVRQFLENSGFHKHVPKQNLYVKLNDAVEQAQIDRKMQLERNKPDNVSS